MNSEKKDEKITMTEIHAFGIAGIPDEEVTADVKHVYGDSPEKLSIALQVGQIAGEFSHQVSASGVKGVNGRREYRRKCRDYISRRAKETVIQPKGFIMGFVFWAVLSGIISWWVQKLMRKYFDEEN